MKLYLVRHGRAKSKTEDPERGLTELGLEEVKKTAAQLAASGIVKPVNIYHSPKKRAEQTARVMADALKPEKGVAVGEGLLPNDSILIWIENMIDRKEDLMLVGHLPYMSVMTSGLLGCPNLEDMVRFTPSSVLCFEVDPLGKWTIQWFLDPELI